MSGRAICTILTKNYSAYARTLIQSVRLRNPDVKCYGLVIDEWQGYINPEEEPFELVSLEQLNIPRLRSVCFKYDANELANALKPFLLKFLLAQGCSPVLYLDSDILVTGSLEGLFNDLSDADVVITPHLDIDYPDDGLLPNDAVILRAGMFNLGFIGVKSSPRAGTFLDWWAGKLYNHCVVDMEQGYFVDQKFIDIAYITLDGIHVERNVGYNTAHFNLHGRQLSRRDGEWFCNGGPLYFFHFSGYDVETPELMSKFTTRYRLSGRPDVRPIFEQYKTLLLANEYEKRKQWPYGFGAFAGGMPIKASIRKFYRQSPERWEEFGDPFSSQLLQFLSLKEREPVKDINGFRDVARRRLRRMAYGALDRLLPY